MVIAPNAESGDFAISEYQAIGIDSVLVDETESILVADFSRNGVDLQLNWDSGQQVTILDYFSTLFSNLFPTLFPTHFAY